MMKHSQGKFQSSSNGEIYTDCYYKLALGLFLLRTHAVPIRSKSTSKHINDTDSRPVEGMIFTDLLREASHQISSRYALLNLTLLKMRHLHAFALINRHERKVDAISQPQLREERVKVIKFHYYYCVPTYYKLREN